MPYEDSKNKQTIRRIYDYALLKKWQKKIQRPLTYFGLPGPEIQDLLDWRELLDKRRTGVESYGRHKKHREDADETIGRLNNNVMGYGPEFSSGFELLIADVENIIIDGNDDSGKQPCMSDKGPPQSAKFAYDLVNLDFNSGLGYLKKGQVAAIRVEALKDLFKRQRGHSFVFFLTISVRHTLGQSFDVYLAELGNRDYGQDWTELLGWYLGKGQVDYKLKATVPSFIHSASEPHGFGSVCLPPITYVGHETRLVHFAFLMESYPRAMRAFSPQDERALIELPLLTVEDGVLKFAKDQHPGFDKKTSESCLSFLPEDVRQSVMDSR